MWDPPLDHHLAQALHLTHPVPQQMTAPRASQNQKMRPMILILAVDKARDAGIIDMGRTNVNNNILLRPSPELSPYLPKNMMEQWMFEHTINLCGKQHILVGWQ